MATESMLPECIPRLRGELSSEGCKTTVSLSPTPRKREQTADTGIPAAGQQADGASPAPTRSSSAPPILVLNLDRSADRWVRIQRALWEEGLDPTRIEAVDGHALSHSQIDEHLSPWAARLMQRPPRPGEVGCHLSHCRAWQAIVDRNLDYAVILEDDATPVAGVGEFLRSLHAHQLSGLDMLRLHAKRGSSGKRIPSGFRLNGARVDFQLGKLSSATAYILTNAGARKLLARSKMRCPVDWLTFTASVVGVRHAVLEPSLFEPDATTPTTIQNLPKWQAGDGGKASVFTRRTLAYFNTRILTPAFDLATAVVNWRSLRASRSKTERA